MVRIRLFHRRPEKNSSFSVRHFKLALSDSAGKKGFFFSQENLKLIT
jgi:hypothetical protein